MAERKEILDTSEDLPDTATGGPRSLQDSRAVPLPWSTVSSLLRWYIEATDSSYTSASYDAQPGTPHRGGLMASQARSVTIGAKLARCPFHLMIGVGHPLRPVLVAYRARPESTLLEDWVALQRGELMAEALLTELERKHSRLPRGIERTRASMRIKGIKRQLDAIKRTIRLVCDDRRYPDAQLWLSRELGKCAADDASFMRY